MQLKNWMVALDLTQMDQFLLEYVNFLAELLEPEEITFLHIVEQQNLAEEVAELFPEAADADQFHEMIREEIYEKVEEQIKTECETSILIVSGSPTDTMIQTMQQYHPDLLVMGKKSGFEGKGIIANKIVKYVPGSVLLVPETSRFNLENILVPINFNEYSAKALQFTTGISGVSGASLTAQHVYNYPTQFFPSIPAEQFEEEMQEPLKKKLNKFKRKYSLSEEIDYIFTLNNSKKIPDLVYDQSIRQKSDLIVVGARNRSTLSNVLMDELADRMMNYSFGIPILIYKDKKEFKGLIESLISR